MTFWTDPSVEPKRKFRFKVRFFDSSIIWYAKSVSAPSFEISNVEHHFSDHVFNYPGKIKWNDVEVVLVDPATQEDDVVKKTLSLLEASGYKVPLSTADPALFDTFAKTELVTANGNIKIIAQNAAGEDIETWTLNNAFITNVKFGDFDYSSEDLREISITFKYDWASCNVQGQSYFPGATSN